VKKGVITKFIEEVKDAANYSIEEAK